jgi:hypothetical protein
MEIPRNSLIIRLVGKQIGLDASKKKIKQKSLPVPEIDPRFSRRPARNLVSIFM